MGSEQRGPGGEGGRGEGGGRQREEDGEIETGWNRSRLEIGIGGIDSGENRKASG